MATGNDDSGRIDLDALIRDAVAANRERTKLSPPTVLPVEIDPPPPPQVLDSLAAVATEQAMRASLVSSLTSTTEANPATSSRRGPVLLAVGAAVAIGMFAGGTIALLRARAITTATPAPNAMLAPNPASPTSRVETLVPSPRPASNNVAPAIELRASHTLPGPAAAVANAPIARPKLPNETPPKAAEPTPAEPLAAAQPAPSAPAIEPAPAAASQPEPPAPAPTPAPTPEATSPTDLGAAIHAAAVPRDPNDTSASSRAEAGPSAAQLRPSAGALTSALRAVMPEARSCIANDPNPRNGLLVFKSDGTVARIDMYGTKPEDDCIRSALTKAKVAPFHDELYSMRFTVRP